MNQKDDITEEMIHKQLRTKVFGKTIYYKEEIDSTNTEAKRQAAEEAGHGLLVIADRQTLGKGRRGRSWSSPKGTGIWMSLLLRPKLAANKASMLTLVTALSVAEAIFENTGLETSIKWPNDIVVNGKKVCGILTEMSADNSGILYVVIGIGVNVNTREFPEEIQAIATSLLIEKSKQTMQVCINRSGLVSDILEKLEQNYEAFLVNEDLSFLLESYNKKLANRDRQVKVLGSDGQVELSGIAKGINKEGELLVETEEGLVEVRSGEVSVRGLYGYV